MPAWNDLTDAQRQAIISVVWVDDNLNAQIALDVYNKIRAVLDGREVSQ